MKQLNSIKRALLTAVACSASSVFAQSPTAPALGFNVFLQNGGTFYNSQTEGPVAMGGNLTIGGSYVVSTNQTGTFSVNNVKVTMLVGGRVNYLGGNTLQINQNGYIKIGDSTGSYVWYKDNNNAFSPMRITQNSTYYTTPKISLSASSQTLGVSATNNPVFQDNLLDFASAFTTMKYKSTSMGMCNDNAALTSSLGLPILLRTLLPSQVRITLNTGINYLNLSGADLNSIQTFTFLNQPSATRILVVNVNAPGTFNWSPWNSSGIGGTNTPFIIYNFYNTTTLNIQGSSAVLGTVFAPYADITKTVNQSDIFGQVIGQSFVHNGGGNQYFPFTPAIPGCAAAPVAAFTVNSSAQCLTVNSFVFNNNSTGGTGLTYRWTFGDGGTSTSENPSKTYTSAGTYTVKLVVTGAGGSDSTTRTVSVSAAAASAGFTVNDSSQFLLGNAFTFTSSGSTSGNTYRWTFGDGTVSSDINPVKSYLGLGTYTIKQVVTSAGGCKDSVSKNVVVKSVLATVAQLNVNNGSQCVNGNSFKFTSISLGSLLSVKWYFGDGETSESPNPTKTFTSPGTYTVKLVVSGLGGTDSISLNVTVNPLPQTGFTVNDSSQFLPVNNFVFTPAGSTSSNTYAWSFGDGTSSTAATPSKTYSAAGTYLVKQRVTTTAGCIDSFSRNVTVKLPSPTAASFTVNNAVQCVGSNVFNFTGTSTGSGTLTYAWTFGDATTSTMANPSKTYSSAGTYIVKLVVTGLGGKDSTTRTVTVGSLPVAGFTVNDSSQYLAINRFSFTTTTPVAGNSYLWTFGDGTFSNDTNPSKTYLLAGNYTARQEVTSPLGCKAAVSKTMAVNIPLLTTALFNINNATQCLTGNSFVFTSVSVGTLLSLKWEFGDGSTSDNANPVKTYAAPGTYTVKLVVSALGGKDSITAQVTVNPLPVIGYAVSDTVQFLSGNSFSFSPTGSTAGNTYLWDFGDGTTSSATNPVKSYAAIGTYNVRQIVTSSNNCRDTFSTTIVVKSPSLTVAGFIINDPAQCLSSNSFAFNSVSTGSGALTYNWIFGDATTSTAANPVKTYAAAGTYNVKLVVTGAGGSDSMTRTVLVSEAPSAAFTVNDSLQFLTGNSYQFTSSNTTLGNIHKWSFGDGTIAFDINPLKLYVLAGTYTVKQEVTSLAGCRDSFSRVVTVSPVSPTLAAFSINNTVQCLSSNAFSFTSTSFGTGLLSALWDFGDGTISSLLNPVKTYSAPGTYVIKLLVNALGGKDSITRTITVLPLPITGFLINDTAQFVTGNSFTFTPANHAAGNTYSWDFGDGTTSTDSIPSKTYSSPGLYRVKQLITSAGGCRDSISLDVRVNAVFPTAALFSIGNASQCVTDNVFQFVNTSFGSGLLSYLWDFGDGTISTVLNPVKTYNFPGTYQVKLRVSALGGMDSISFTVTVRGLPQTGFSISDSTQFLVGNSFRFKATGNTSLDTYKWDFGDGTFATDSDVVKSFPDTGTYFIRQIVTSPFGCRDSIIRKVIVQPVLATLAAFTINQDTQCLGSNAFRFMGSSVGSGALRYLWDFGDGTISSLVNPLKTYAVSGTFTVKLVTEGLGGKDSVTQTVHIRVASSGFSINDTTQLVLGNNFAFLTLGALAGNTYFWDFGDGTTSTLANPFKTYATAGTYLVKQVVTNASGCKDSSFIPVVVEPIIQTLAGFHPNDSVKCSRNPFTFFNTSLGGGTLSYLWDFGDGSTSTALAPVKTYAANGTYTVKLVVSGIGGTDSMSRNVTVVAGATKGFTINDSIQPLTGNSFTFTTAPVVTGYTYRWSFSDNTFSTDINPMKTYFVGGTYIVTQVATAPNGCKDSLSLSIIVESDSVGSGNGGGIESESLGGLVTKRDFMRMKNNIDARIDYSTLPVFVRASSAGSFGKAAAIRLADMIPQHLLPSDIPRISTPADLLNMTIALEVLSVDYTMNNQAKGAVLGIKTAGRAYNHTKPVCDRLRGGTLFAIDTVRILNYMFTRFTLKQENNTVEYGISFVAGTKTGRNTLTLQTNWLISEYIDDDTMFTFQVWSTQPSYTEKLVSDIITNLTAAMPLNQLDLVHIPKAYVTYGQRVKENLILTIHNSTEESYGKIVFEQRMNEQSIAERVEIQVTLPRFESKQFSVPVKDGYEYEGMIYLDNRLEDAIYMADGNWGLDYDHTKTTISQYVTGNDPARVYRDNELAVYRNVTLRSNTNDYITVYKAISQGNAKTNLTAYNNMRFYAKGNGQVSVRLTKDAIVSWNNQYATTITLDTAGRVYNIPFRDLQSPSQAGPFMANDVKLIGFTYVGDGSTRRDFNFYVNDIVFNSATTGIKEEQKIEAVGVYPNPSEGSFSVSFYADAEETMDLVVTDVLGKVIYTKKVTAVQGNNISRVDLSSPVTGIYFVKLKGTNKPYSAARVLVD